MAIENVNGSNKISKEDLQRVRSQRIDPPKSQEPVQPPESVSGAESNKTEAQTSQGTSISDLVEISSNKPGEAEVKQQPSSKDTVEISWQDPEMLERIQELIDRIRSQKEVIAQRVEAARVLILERAYDSNEELKKTAEAILRGETVEDIDLTPTSGY